MYWGGGHFYWWMDSTGGLLLSLFVLYCWSKNALENARTLLGIKAEPDLMTNLNFIANHHHPLIKSVSSVIAYQIGPGFLAEVSIAFDNETSLEEASQTADSLKKKLERVEDIEHAYVHIETVKHSQDFERKN